MAGMQNIRWWHGLPVPSVCGMANIAVLGTGRMGAAIARRPLADTVAVARAVGVDVDRALSVVANGALGSAVARAARS
jgi:3-hydroxyisobutyrate dehydrogenase-like beta-hydroxyacid dehydrogenase